MRARSRCFSIIYIDIKSIIIIIFEILFLVKRLAGMRKNQDLLGSGHGLIKKGRQAIENVVFEP
jgi:hypothetical protein